MTVASPRVLQVINSLSVRYGGTPAAAVVTALALHDEGFDVKHASRYVMFYRHHPHTVSRLLSARACFPIGVGAYRLFNGFFGSYGNKLTVVAVRP